MFYLRTQTTGRAGADARRLGAVGAVAAGRLPGRPPQRSGAGLRPGPHVLRPHPAPGGALVPPVQAGVADPAGGSMGTRRPHQPVRADAATAGPRVFLDQMWLRFDLARTVFVTAGKQHARWGTGAILVAHRLPAHPPPRPAGRVRRPHRHHHAEAAHALGVAGLELLRLRPAGGRRATPTSARSAAPARAEIVLGTTEIGPGRRWSSAAASRSWRPTSRPASGTWISTARWPCATAARSTGSWSAPDTGWAADGVAARPSSSGCTRSTATAASNRRWSGGADATARSYNDNDVWNLGVEYFYNALGYDSPEAYPGLILPRTTPLVEPATFFYLGRQYGAVFLSVPAPYSWDYTTFTLSTLGNFSDGSYITRLDYSLLMLTHLRFEAFVAAALRHARGRVPFRGEELQGRRAGPSTSPRDSSISAWRCA